MTPSYLDRARVETRSRFDALRTDLVDAETLIAGRACVYATGSFGRLEAGPFSDLDLFIVVDKFSNNVGATRTFSGIDETKLAFHLISAVERSEIAEFDAGGRFLKSHGITDFVSALGSQSDDYYNTLTGRVLLLLESKPLLNTKLYDRLLEDVVAAYFRDFEGNEGGFVPSFLINDIMRLWRTFCVNYEFSRKKGSDDIKIKNLKLKFSRMLTCYSAIMYLISVHVRSCTVSPPDVIKMASLSPVERLEHLKAENCFTDVLSQNRFSSLLDSALDEYSKFLEFTHKPKIEIIADYEKLASEWKDASYRFGSSIAEALAMLGTSKGDFDRLYRIVLI